MEDFARVAAGGTEEEDGLFTEEEKVDVKSKKA